MKDTNWYKPNYGCVQFPERFWNPTSTEIWFQRMSFARFPLNAIALWADSTTDATSSRRRDLIREKQAALLSDGAQGTAAGFFVHCQKLLPSVIMPVPEDVKLWMAYLEEFGLSAATIYSRVSKLSSFFNWLANTPEFRGLSNPVDYARPKAPRAYQNRSSQSLTDEQVRKLLAVVKADADAGKLTGLRDYTLLRFFFATGKRREEIIQLRWGDLEWTGSRLIITTKDKGGVYTSAEIADKEVSTVLVHYLNHPGRLPYPMLPTDPLWLRHDNGAHPNQPLTSRGFVNMLKKYAKEAGIGDIHLHQTRHTVARWAGEELGSLTDVQTVLGHASAQTTKVYLQRVGVKKDKISKRIAEKLREE